MLSRSNMLKNLLSTILITNLVCPAIFVCLLGCFFANQVAAQSIIELKRDNSKEQSISFKRKRALEMLDDIKKIVKRYYYDSNFRGINLDEKFANAAQNIKQAESNGQIYINIAQVLAEFDDSHTSFYPPPYAQRVDYGFELQMIGENCYIIEVEKGSDAEKKGLKAGDVVAAVDRYAPSRENLSVIMYLFHLLDPRTQLQLKLKSGAQTREITVESKLSTVEELRKQAKEKGEEQEPLYKCHKFDTNSIVCRLYTFMAAKREIDKMMAEVGEHKNFILDLRGNPGGYVRTFSHLASYFFDANVKVGEEKRRDSTKEQIIQPNRKARYKGTLTVLVDSESTSASEVFAQVIKTEKRGQIIGDKTGGKVMTSAFFGLTNLSGSFGNLALIPYGLNVTVADLIMKDGKRLENAGVSPNVLIYPNARQIADKKDPVLVYAASQFNVKITPEAAGLLFKPKKKDEYKTAESKTKPEEDN